MAGQNDFLIFDENLDNILTQELYVNDEDRTDGFKTGLARSNVNNKVLRQTSIMASAIGEIIKKQGGQATDSSLSNLVGSIERVYGVKKYYIDATFGLGEWVLGSTGDDEGFYKSLIANNIGNALTNTTAWEKVESGANTNLSNLTATGKTKVVTLANELDWNNAISVSTSTGTRTYTPTIDGVMLLSAFSSGGNASKDVYAYFTLPSGHQVGNQLLGTNQAIYNTTYLYVKSNTQITYTLGLGNSSGTLHNEVKAIFIPFKKS